MKLKSIMIVEMNLELRNLLRHAFESRGYLTWTCPLAELATSIFEAAQPSAVILDLDVETIDCTSLIEEWHRKDPRAKIIVESGDGNMDRIRKAMDHGAEAFLSKPYSLAPLFELLEKEIPAEPLPDKDVKKVA